MRSKMYIVKGSGFEEGFKDFKYKSFRQALRAWGRCDRELYYYTKMSGFIHIGNLKDDLGIEDLERAFSNPKLKKKMQEKESKK